MRPRSGWCDLWAVVFGVAVILIPVFSFDAEYRVVRKVVLNCSDAEDKSSCLANKAAKAIERAMPWDVPIFDGVTLVKDEEAPLSEGRNDTELRHWSNGVGKLSAVVLKFLDTHKVSVDLSEPRQGDGGKGKKRKKEGKYLKYALMVLLGIFGISAPLILKTLALIAGKALIASKIALLIVGSVALKKIFDKDNKDQSNVKVHTHTIQDSGYDKYENEHERIMDYGAYNFLKTI